MVDRRAALATMGPRGEITTGKALALLSFSLDGELYAVPLDAIQSIIAVPELTDVPRSHPCILGICSVRGVLVTVIDLRRRMQVAERALTRQARILLTINGEEMLGILVDSVHRVARVPPDQFEHTAALIGEDTTEHVLGIARVRKRDDWSALNVASGTAAGLQGDKPSEAPPRSGGSEGSVSQRGVHLERAGATAERLQSEEDEAEVIVVLNLESVCRVSVWGGRKS